MGHEWIEREAVRVETKLQPKRNPRLDLSPWITEGMLKGVDEVTGKVDGYASGVAHKGTFYREFEGITVYQDEPFIRVVIYGDESQDFETRIPLNMLKKAGFVFTPKVANNRIAPLTK